MQTLKNEFELIYSDKSKGEQDFQAFIEKNTSLVPRAFEQNHGVHMDLVFRKFPLGTRYKSDFLFLSKSTTDWNAVHIEIEDPNKKIFTKGGTFTAEFNAAVQQVESWIAWLSDPINLQTFESSIKSIKQPLGNNPTKHKFVLVYGRRDELDTDEKLGAFGAKKSDQFQLMTYDSLFENKKPTLHTSSITQGKIKIHCNCDLDDNFLNFVNAADFMIDEQVRADKIAKLSTVVTGAHANIVNESRKNLLHKWKQTQSYK